MLIRCCSWNRIEKPWLITHVLAPGDGENVPIRAKSPQGCLQTIQGNRDAALTSEPCRGAATRLLNSDREQSSGLSTRREQDTHGN